MFTLIKYTNSGKFLCQGRIKYVTRIYLALPEESLCRFSNGAGHDGAHTHFTEAFFTLITSYGSRANVASFNLRQSEKYGLHCGDFHGTHE